MSDTTLSPEVSRAAASAHKAEEAKGKPAEAKPSGPPRHEIKLGADAEPIEVLAGSKGEIGQRLQTRLIIAEDLRQDQKRLGTIDRLLLDKGSSVIEKFNSGETLTREELAVAWAVIHDELVQKASATDRLVQQAVTEGQEARFQILKKIPFLKRFSREEKPSEPTAETALVPSKEPRLITDYMSKTHFMEWKPEQIDTDLKSLNNLRVALESQLGFEPSADDWTIPDFTKGSSSRLHNAVVDRMRFILAREHEGKSFVELNEEDPLKAAVVRHKAIQEGLIHFSPEFAKSVLLAEKPEVDLSKIDKQIARIDKPADKKEVTKRTEAREKAQTKFNEAKRKYDQLKEEGDKIDETIQEKEEALNDAKANYDAVHDRLDIEIERLRDDLAALPSPPVGADAETMAVYMDGVGKERERINREISGRDQEMRRLLLAKASAEQARDRAKTRKILLESNDEDKIGSVKWAKKQFDEAEGDFKEKKKAHKELTEPPKDKADRKRALEMWKMVGTNYEKVIALGFAQGGDEAKFTRSRLASVDEIDGQLEGAELLREYILGTINPEWEASKKDRRIAREMLPDGEIALAIVRTFNIDISLMTEPDNDREFLKEVLPYLRNANQFQVGDMVRFMLSQGLRGAEKGKHKLDIKTDLIRSEARSDAASVMREDLGSVAFGENGETHRPQFVWTGTVREMHGLMFGDPGATLENTDLTFRVTQQFDRGLVTAGVEVNVNEDFLKHLPPTVSADMPRQIQETFYSGGVLRTEITEIKRNTFRRWKTEISKINVPEWITVSDPALNGQTGREAVFTETTAGGMLNDLATAYSPEMSRKIATQTANEILEMSPSERLKIIKGLPDINLSITLPGETEPDDAVIRFDNEGNLWLDDKSDDSTMDINSFYNRFYHSETDGRIPSADDRRNMQRFYGQINQIIGQRILENQQFKG